MKKSLLIVDLDDTLTDISGPKKAMFYQLSQVSGVSLPKVNGSYQIIKNDNLLPQNWPDLLSQQLSNLSGANKNQLRRVIFSLPKKLKINKPLLRFIKKFKGFKILLTCGDKKFQQAKIKHLKLHRFFDSIVITPGDKKEFIKSCLKKNNLKLKNRSFDSITIIDDQRATLASLNRPWLKILHPNNLVL